MDPFNGAPKAPTPEKGENPHSKGTSATARPTNKRQKADETDTESKKKHGIHISMKGHVYASDVEIFKRIAHYDEKPRNTDIPEPKIPISTHLDVDVTPTGEYQLTFIAKTARKGSHDEGPTSSADRASGTTDGPQTPPRPECHNQPGKKGPDDQTPLEDFGPVGVVPDLPYDMDNLQPSLVEWMKSTNALSRDNQKRLEKLWMRCQRCNCNNVPQQEPEVGSNEEDRKSQPEAKSGKDEAKSDEEHAESNKKNKKAHSDVPAASDKQTWGAKDEPETQAKNENWRKRNDGDGNSRFDENDILRAKLASFISFQDPKGNEPVLPRVRELRHITTPQEGHSLKEIELFLWEILAPTIRYWEILSGGDIESDGSIAVVSEWLSKAIGSGSAGNTNNDTPSSSDENTDSGRVLGKTGSSKVESDQAPAPKKKTDAELRAEAAEIRRKEEEKKREQIKKYAKKHAQPEKSRPRNKTFPKTPRSTSMAAKVDNDGETDAESDKGNAGNKEDEKGRKKKDKGRDSRT